MRITIEKARDDDAEEIMALLTQFDATPGHWKKLFKPRSWKIKDDFPGFIMRNEGRIVGFIGVILSEYVRPTTGERFTICNNSTWYVEPAYRKHSVSLLLQVMQLPNVSWTSLTSLPTGDVLLKKLGFKELQSLQSIVLPIPSLRRYPGVQVIVSPCEALLTPEEKIISRAHKGLSCQELLINQGLEHCYCVLVKGRHKKIPIAKIYYMSNVKLMMKLIASIRWQLCIKLRVAYLVIEGDILEGNKCFGMWNKKLPLVRRFKSDCLAKEEIPILYSELFVLGI